MKEKQSFWQSLSSAGRRAAGATFYMYFHLGIVVIMIGSLLPQIQAEYQLSYRLSGLLLSSMNFGHLFAGALCGLMTVAIGTKRSVLMLCNLLFFGLFLITRTRVPALLLLSMLLIGMSKGSITNYNNLIISKLSGGSARPLNLLHACFAIGACLAPFLVLLCVDGENASWRTAIYVVLALGILQVLLQCRMRDDDRPSKAERGNLSLGFFKERAFLLSASVMFCYLCVETSMMGWLVSYFLDTGAMQESFAQVLTSVLWASLLAGRLLCAAVAGRFPPRKMILCMCGGILLFFTLLMLSKSFLPMAAATVGLGLCMSGMYGTTVANAGDVFSRYPLAMGAFVALPGLGTVLAPTLIGTLADRVGLRLAMCVLFFFAVFGVVFAVLNNRAAEKNAVETSVERNLP